MKKHRHTVKFIKFVAINIISIFSYAYSYNSIAATYYVDTNNTQSKDLNPGSQELPWKTILKASKTLAPGDTVIIKAGTYNEEISTERSGTQTGRITYKASGLVNILGASIQHNFITIDGFTTNNDNNINIYNGSNCQVTNNHLIKSAIQMHFVNSDDLPSNCLIKGNKLDSASSNAGDWPMIEIFGSNNIIDGNEIGPASDIDAFRTWGHHNTIRNNYVHDITYSPNSQAHMDIFQSFSLNGWSANNIIIENNRFINFDGQLCMTSTDSSPKTHDFIIRNNVFAHIKQHANIGIKNMLFLNNTFYDVSAFSGYKNDWGTTENTTFKNNIFVGASGYNPDFYDSNLFVNPEPWIFENNYFSTISGNPLKNFNTSQQINSVNGGAINFKNAQANDFSILPGSVVIDKGILLNGFSYDINGTLRPQGKSWDIGAYEFASSTNSTLLLPPSNLTIQ